MLMRHVIFDALCLNRTFDVCATAAGGEEVANFECMSCEPSHSKRSYDLPVDMKNSLAKSGMLPNALLGCSYQTSSALDDLCHCSGI